VKQSSLNSLTESLAETTSTTQLARSLALARLAQLRAVKEGLTDEDAAQKRDNFLAFVEYVMPSFETAPHHRVICRALEDVEKGRIDRLMISVPRRHGKSEIASRKFAAWYLGRHPDREIITASYGGDLARDFGYDVRNLMQSPSYKALFDTRLAEDKTAAGRWNTKQGGVYLSTSVGGSTVGRGSHVLIIDDPHKDREEADSGQKRANVSRWYRSAAYPTLLPGGAIVLISTRWRDDDLQGELLEEADHGGDRWSIINLPAIAGQDDALGRSPGDALWPKWYPLDVLKRIRRTIGQREWQAQYQQDPQPDEGDYFKSEWVRWYKYKDRPKHLQIYGASDYAVTEDDGDFTVHGVFGVDPEDNIYILDWWRGQTESDEWVESFLDLAEKWKPAVWGEEKDQIGKSLGPFITKRQRERRVYVLRRQYSSARNKAQKARSFQARMSMGKVYFPRDKYWGQELINEMLRFPTGKNDDQVDTCSLVGRMLDRMVSGRSPPVSKAMELRPPTLDELVTLTLDKTRRGGKPNRWI